MSIEKEIQIICATQAGSYVYWNLYQRKYPKIPPLKSGAGMTSSPGGWVEAEVERHATPPGSWTYMTGLLSINMWLLRSHNYWFWLMRMTPEGSYVYRKTKAWKLPTPAGSYVYWYLYQGKYPKIPPPENRGRNDIVSRWMGWGRGMLAASPPTSLCYFILIISHSDRREESLSSLSGKKPLNLKEGQRLKDMRPLRGREPIWPDYFL